MKVTKYVHSCLLVEAEGRAVLFDPGVFSEAALDVDKLTRLDNIFITHSHFDHMHAEFIKKVQDKFPDVPVTVPADAVSQLESAGVKNVSTAAPEGVHFFDSPHEQLRPMSDAEPPQEIGVHYLDRLSHPGDSHSFHETKAILALPVQAPWGSTVDAARVALSLRPQHILPIHDWHWSTAAREQLYGALEQRFASERITFHKLQTGVPVEIEV